VITFPLSKVKAIIYCLLECLLSNGLTRKINDVPLRFPISVSRYYPANYEPYTQDFILKYGQGVCVDVGAHIGLYTVLMARKADRVIAIEPALDNFKLLEKTLEINNLSNVELVRKVVWENNEFVDFHLADAPHSVANSVSPIGSSVTMPAMTLDSLETRVYFCKIDAEGAELRVLKGARTMLKSLSYLHLAIHPRQMFSLGDEVQQLLALLKEYSPQYRFKGETISEDGILRIKELFDLEIALNGESF
jgi:FkbM family methyltransferase